MSKVIFTLSDDDILIENVQKNPILYNNLGDIKYKKMVYGEKY